MWKRHNFEGGVADPLVVSWPKGIDAKGELRHQFLHATDIVPTIYDLLGVELPEAVKGYAADAARGRELPVDASTSADAPTPKESAFFSMLGSRAIWQRRVEGGAASTRRSPAGATSTRTAGSSSTPTRTRPRCHDLAAENPEKLKELIDLWFHEAGRYNGLPLDGPDRGRGARATRRDRRCAPPRDRYIYYPDAAEVPEAAAVNIRNRSYTIAAEVDIDSEDAARRAVLARRALRRPLRCT